MSISVLKDKRIVLGVTGSISCYKAVDFASKLTQAGALVDVILTDSAEKFVTPLTFQSVTGRPAYNDMWSEKQHVQHVGLGESADLFVIAPATAHTLGKLAHGLADNLLTVTALTARCPILVAPAMDGGMYAHAAVAANVATLKQRGVYFAGPKEGRMASGLVGMGRLVETPEMLGTIRQILGADGVLAGKKVIVSAGPTQEPFDPVRYISNRSTGKQGVAVAQAAIDMGADVTLIHGPIAVPLPIGATLIKIRTAQELHDAVLAQVAEADVLVMAAAVGDFRPKTIAKNKIKKDPKTKATPQVELARNPDILLAVKQWKAEKAAELVVVGFAAETADIVAHGQDKLIRKGLDWIAVNNVGGAQTGFAVDTNHVFLLHQTGQQIELPLQSKQAIAAEILQHIAKRLPK